MRFLSSSQPSLCRSCRFLRAATNRATSGKGSLVFQVRPGKLRGTGCGALQVTDGHPSCGHLWVKEAARLSLHKVSRLELSLAPFYEAPRF